MRRLPIVVLLLTSALAMSRLYGQAPPGPSPQPPAFEVASIKLNTSGDPRSGTQNSPGGRVTITNQPLRSMIPTAYGSNDLEVIGGPDWMAGDRWDILATAPPGDPEHD